MLLCIYIFVIYYFCDCCLIDINEMLFINMDCLRFGKGWRHERKLKYKRVSTIITFSELWAEHKHTQLTHRIIFCIWASQPQPQCCARTRVSFGVCVCVWTWEAKQHCCVTILEISTRTPEWPKMYSRFSHLMLYKVSTCGNTSSRTWHRHLASGSMSLSFMNHHTAAAQRTPRPNTEHGTQFTIGPSGHA